jgi:superfamily I DNA/RNA helicase
MHRMKGLGFQCVAVVGVGEHQIPASSAVTLIEDDPLAYNLDVQRERCLLLVARTRTREDRSTSWHGQPSPPLRLEHDT